MHLRGKCNIGHGCQSLPGFSEKARNQKKQSHKVHLLFYIFETRALCHVDSNQSKWCHRVSNLAAATDQRCIRPFKLINDYFAYESISEVVRIPIISDGNLHTDLFHSTKFCRYIEPFLSASRTCQRVHSV